MALAVAALAATLGQDAPAARPARALPAPLFPLLAAALFALAPVRVESVAWATERRDLLGALFAVAAVAALPAGQLGRRRDRGARFGGGATRPLAALARAQVSLPFVLLLLDPVAARPAGRH